MLSPDAEPQTVEPLPPLPDNALEARIRQLPKAPLTHAAIKHMSLAGAQHKLAVVLLDISLGPGHGRPVHRPLEHPPARPAARHERRRDQAQNRIRALLSSELYWLPSMALLTRLTPHACIAHSQPPIVSEQPKPGAPGTYRVGFMAAPSVYRHSSPCSAGHGSWLGQQIGG